MKTDCFVWRRIIDEDIETLPHKENSFKHGDGANFGIITKIECGL